MKKEQCRTVEKSVGGAKALPAVELHRELVPLAEAAAVAYHVVTQKPNPPKDPLELEEVRCLVAIALSTIAPILYFENGQPVPLAAPQIEERLFRGSLHARKEGRTSDLSGLFMRRGDMIDAIEVLKEAHASFGRPRHESNVRPAP